MTDGSPRLHRVDDRRRVLVRPRERHGLAALEHPLDALVLEKVLLAAADVLPDRDAVPLDLVVVRHEPRHVLGGMLTRLGREVAEPPVELHAHAPLELRIRLDAGVEKRVEVLAVALEAEDERLVVEARRKERDLVDGHTDEGREILRRELDGVAETDDVLRRRAAVDEPAEHRHRVRVVEQPGTRAELRHLAPEREHVVGGAERAEDAADPERVRDRLAQTVPRRDLEVEQRRRMASDLHHVDHVVGAVERLPAARGARRSRARHRAPAPRSGPSPPPSPACRGRCRGARSRCRPARGRTGCRRGGSS